MDLAPFGNKLFILWFNGVICCVCKWILAYFGVRSHIIIGSIGYSFCRYVIMTWLSRKNLKISERKTPFCLSLWLCSDIGDKTLIALARKITADGYYDIGRRLGFERNELEHIEHGTLLNRKDANVRMLSRWKALQGVSGGQAMRQATL